MCLIFNCTLTWLLFQFYIYTFQAFCLSSCPRFITIRLYILPSIGLYMCLIIYTCLFIQVGISRVSTKIIILIYQYNLYCFYSFTISTAPCILTVFGPIQPAKCLTVNSIINIIFSSQFSGKSDLHSF